MAPRYTETQVIAAVSRLTPSRLTHYLRARLVQPVQTGAGPAFREIDLARLELLCDLSDDLELDDAALAVVVSLIDQLHAARSDLRRVLRALQDESEDVRGRVARAMLAGR